MDSSVPVTGLTGRAMKLEIPYTIEISVIFSPKNGSSHGFTIYNKEVKVFSCFYLAQRIFSLTAHQIEIKMK